MKDGEDNLFIPLNRRKEASNKLVIIINLLVEVFMCEFRDFQGGGGWPLFENFTINKFIFPEGF